ncbi:MAG: hypothetical protein ACC707_03735 [Thiohalomonadales bacterium]
MTHRLLTTYSSLLNLAKPLGLMISALFFITACDNSDGTGAGISQKVPQGLIAKAGARSVTLNWGGVANADRYTVYWSNNPDLNRSDSATIQTTQPLYTHDELRNGSTYYYAVTSHTGGIESRLSDEVSALPEEAAPLKPAALDLKAEDGRITINYDTGIAGVIQYQLLWDSGASTALADSPRRFNLATNPFVHDNLTNGQTYRYLLRVTNAAGKSTDSEVFQSKPQAALALAPVITTVIASRGQAVLTWLDNSNADGFDLYWSNSSDVTTASAYVRQVNSPFTHAPLSEVAEQHYYYRLQARNSAGVSPLSNLAHVTTPDGGIIKLAGDLPAMPATTDSSAVINIRADDGQLTLVWQENDPTALAYNLYWRRGTTELDTAIVVDSANNEGVMRNIKPPYTHMGLQNNVYYYYRLSAINHAGESDLSALTYAERPERIVPGVPSGVAILTADQSLSIRWNPVDRADSYSLTVDGNTTTEVVSPHTLTSLVNGQTYAISLQSVTATRTSQPSPVVTASPRVARPFAPTRLLATGGNGQVRLQWDGVTAPTAIDPSEAAISAYQVYRATQAGVSARNGKLLPFTPTPGADDNSWQVDVPKLDNGQRYYFIVTALNSGGEGPASNAVWSLPQISIPSAPSQLSARPGDAQVTLHFAPANDATGSPSYNLYWSKRTANGRSPTQVITNISQSPDYIFSDGKKGEERKANGTTYYFKVSASNPGGESVLSAEVSATPQIPAPQAMPMNVLAQASSTQVDLNWASVDNATSYVIFWSSGSDINAATSARLIANGIDARSLRHTNLRNGQRLFYRIAASNAGGLGPLSPVIDALPQVDPPATPNTFAALAGDAAVTITWEAVPNAVSYRLYWRLSTEPTWSFVQGLQSGYVHMRLGNSSTYDYYLLAQNPGGNSAPTATLQATPQLAVPTKPLGLSIAAGDQQNSINWFSQAGLSYDLHWSTATADPMGSGQVLNDVLPIMTHGRITALSNDLNYHYQIVAKNADGVASPPSDIVSATPRLATAGAPTGLSALGGDQQITLSWFAPANAPADTTYTLYWGTQASAVSTVINNVNIPYVHTILDSNQTYYYRITATVAGTESPPSNLASGALKPTAQPANTVPYISEMNISAFGPITIGKTLTGSYRFNDDDGDDEGASILQWYRNRTALTDGTSSFYTLVAIDAGQVIGFEVTPVASTGKSPGLAKRVDITIAGNNNAAPVVSAVNITGYTGTTTKVNDQLVGNYTFDDVDGDGQGASLFQWRLDGRAITGATQQDYMVSTNDAGKQLTFEVTPVAILGASPGVLVASLPLDVDTATVITQNLVGLSSGMLVGIDAATGNVTARSGLGLAGFTAVKQISYDHINKLIYGINELPVVGFGSKLQFTQIVEIDPISSSKRVFAYTGPEFLNSVGMALDPSTRTIFILKSNGDFYSYDMTSKSTSAVVNIGFNGVRGLAIDVLGGGTLYTIQTSSNQLIAVTTTGIGIAINTLTSSLIVPTPTLSNPVSLSFDPNTDRIIAAVPTVQNATDYLELMAIDKKTAQATSLGGFQARGGPDITLAFAYDPLTLTNNTLYFQPVGTAPKKILQKINLPAYGGQKITRISIPFRDLRAIVFDRNSRAIYGLDEKSKYIFKYSAGAITVEAQVNVPGNISGLAMDPARPNTIYAANRSDLFTIDTTTWAVTYVGFFGTNIIDMAFDPGGGILYGITSASPSGLVTINTATGVASTPIIVTGTRSARPIMGIGFSEPAVGTYQLHGISNGRSIYSIDPKSGVATDIDTTKAFTFDIPNISFDGTNFIAAFSSSIKSVDITNLAGTKYVEVEIVEHTYPGGVASLAGYTDVNTNTDTIYVVNAGPLRYLYTVDPISGLSKKLGQFFNTIHSLAVNPSNNQIYGVGGGDIYSIKTSGTQPLDTLVGTPSGITRLADITFDASGRLFGIDGASNSTSDFIEINPVTGAAMPGFRLPYLQGGRIAYKSSTGDFIMASRNAPYNLSSVSRTGETRRLSELMTNEFAYFDSSKTIFRFPDNISVDSTRNINSAKNDLTTVSVMSIGRIFSKAIAHDDASNALYMINNHTGNLLRIDKNTGQSQLVGYTDLGDIGGLVFDPLSPVGKQLFAYTADAFKFATINPKTGRGTVFQASQSRAVLDFAIDISTDLAGKVNSTTVYANTSAGLATIDLTTGRLGTSTPFTKDGLAAFSGIIGISIDAAGNMYGLAQLDNSDFYIVDIDKVTGFVTHTLKKTGFETRWVLAMDKNTNTLYSFDLASGHLISIDPNSGAGTSRGAPTKNFSQIVYSPSNATTYLQNASTSRILYSIDPSNGNTTFVDGLGKNNIAASGGLAVNPMSLTFYSSDNNFPIRNLSTFNLSASLSITPFIFSEEAQISMIDLEWNSTTNSLFGLSNNSRRLLQITDLPTATGSFVSTQAIGTANYSSLVYNPANDAFITIENESNLLIIDATSGLATKSIPLTGDLPGLYAISAQP